VAINSGVFSATPSVVVQAVSPFFQYPLELLNSLGGPPAPKFNLPWWLLALTCQEEGSDGKAVYNVDLVFLSIFGRAMAGSFAVRKARPNISLFHSYIMSLCVAFGGGILGGMLNGDPPIPVANDMPFFALTVSWWAMNFFPFDLFCSFYESVPGQIIGKALDGMSRYRQVFNQLHKAAGKFKRTPYYPNPVAGPILVGAISACGGLFMPFDKGVSALENGPHFPWRSALACAVIYYLATVDSYVSPVVLHYADVDTIRAATTSFLILVDIFSVFVPDNKFSPWAIHETIMRFFISGGEKTTAPVPSAQAVDKDKKTK